MDAMEIFRLTEKAIDRLLSEQERNREEPFHECRRRARRWPFPGTVEMWLPDENGVEQIALGTCVNLSREGLAMLFDDALPIGLEIALAVHQPEASLHGRAVVRHCEAKDDDFYIGVQFLFDNSIS